MTPKTYLRKLSKKLFKKLRIEKKDGFMKEDT